MVAEKLKIIQTRIKAPKNLYNSFGKYHYRNAEGICEAVKPYLEENNCSLTIADEIVNIGERYYIKATCTLTDCEDGSEVKVSAFARESFDKKGMDDSQITGATSSYARKYALNGLFLLDDTKDADSDEYHNETKEKASKVKAESTAEEKMKSYPDIKSANEKITKSEVKEIQALAESKNLNIEAYFIQAKISSFEDLTRSQYVTLKNRLGSK